MKLRSGFATPTRPQQAPRETVPKTPAKGPKTVPQAPTVNTKGKRGASGDTPCIATQSATLIRAVKGVGKGAPKPPTTPRRGSTPRTTRPATPKKTVPLQPRANPPAIPRVEMVDLEQSEETAALVLAQVGNCHTLPNTVFIPSLH